MPLRPTTKVSQMPADTVLSGTEQLTGLDGSLNITMTIQQIADFVIAQIGGGSETPDFVLSDSGDDFELSLSGEDFELTT